MATAKNRLVGADLIKILAILSVVFIHHKTDSSPEWMRQFYLCISECFLFAGVCGIGMLIYGVCRGQRGIRLLWYFLSPVLFTAVLLSLRKFAVTFFFLVSGYMLAGTMERYEAERSVRMWYKPYNLIPKIFRFYLTLVPVFILGVLVQIFLQGKSYTLWSFLKSFLLGGFKPGSYYIVVMAQCMLIFPFLYMLVKKKGLCGTAVIIGITLLWDIFASCITPISVDVYKFCILRLLPSFALGIYARLYENCRNKAVDFIMLGVGILYLVVFVYGKILPLPIFYQWPSASLFVALFLCPIVSWCIRAFQKLSYTDSPLSRILITLSNATYHIFLVQMIYYRLFGYGWNAKVGNIACTMPVNFIVCILGGVLFYRLFIPVENALLSRLTKKLATK